MRNSQITYQGETLESLNKQLAYVNEALSFSLENWERKHHSKPLNPSGFFFNKKDISCNIYYFCIMDFKLTIKQEAFCQAYVRLGDKSAAYREAYNCSRLKDKSIWELSSTLSRNVKVASRIKDLQSKIAAIAEKKFNITSEEMLKHLNILRNSRIDEYVEFKKGKLSFKDFDKLTKEQLMCIESIKQTVNGIEIKLHGKDWSIEKINKHIGFYEKDNEQKNISMSPEDKERRIAELKAKLLH